MSDADDYICDDSDDMNSGGSDEDDMDTPAAYEEMETPTGGGRNAVSWPGNPEVLFKALTADDIGLEQRKLIQNVQDLTEVESHVARQLLQEMKWNFETVAELYFQDSEKLLAKAGVTVDQTVAAAKIVRSDSGFHVTENANHFTCQVCYDAFEGLEEVKANVREFPSCGHAMCKGCWFQQLKTQIIDEGVSVKIACPGFTMEGVKVKRCNIILDERFVEKLLKEVLDDGNEADAANVLRRYQKQLNDNYVNNNQSIKWCPATDCTNAVRIRDAFDSSSYCTDVACSDGHVWCFNCMEEPHAPADCAQVKDWKKKCAEDSATSSWLVHYTKDCPKCKIAINKDGGCNHMHCRQCDHHFCWVCLGHFAHETYQHTCNKFVQDDTVAASNGRFALQRYTHHFERFSNHAKSRELESKLREQTLSKMEKMQDEGNKTWLDVQFMKQATAQLIEARQILQWTYVIGYYKPPWLSENIFTLNQSELENATEKLSNMLEGEDILKWCDEKERVAMINQTNQVKIRLKHLFGALETWKRGEDDEAQEAGSSAAMAVDGGSSANGSNGEKRSWQQVAAGATAAEGVGKVLLTPATASGRARALKRGASTSSE